MHIIYILRVADKQYCLEPVACGFLWSAVMQPQSVITPDLINWAVLSLARIEVRYRSLRKIHLVIEKAVACLLHQYWASDSGEQNVGDIGEL